MIKLLNLAIGGTIGTVARYLLGGTVHKTLGSNFPYGTLVINLLGCLLLGFFAAFAEKRMVLSHDLKNLLMIGFCGAFTTFSTFILETDGLLKNGEVTRACINIIISVIFGFILFRVGSLVGEII